MEQTNLEELFAKLLSITRVANNQDEENLNDSICLVGDHDKILCLEKKTIDIDGIEGNNAIDYSSENEAVVSNETSAKSSKRQDRRYLPA